MAVASMIHSLSLIFTITLVLIFFFTVNPPSAARRSLVAIASCSNESSNGLLNYHCLFPQSSTLSIPTLILFLLLHFYILITTAQRHFSLVTTKLASHLSLSPSMAAVTLLSLGNGAPDVFASLAALRAGHYRTGLAAILSAGTFVSALVVGFVAIYAAPFAVDPAPFVRDLLFYLTAAFFLFYVYLSAEIFLWQAIGFVAFYFFFVAFVFYMDFGLPNRSVNTSADLEGHVQPDSDVKPSGSRDGDKRASGLRAAFRLISKTWELPVSTLLRLTIPQPAPSQWNRFYASANVALCPLALFVFWISTTAGELVNCLEAIGTLLKLPPALLGLTVLAWGNSVGDLVADVAVAKAGHPAMAMAGCFAGPMFNMLVGLGSALVIQTANIYPSAYKLNFHVGIVIAFVFLLSSLMGSLLVITWCRFRVPRFWGFCLVGIYVAFMAASLVIAMFSG
uniref:Cation/calcium exchanger 3 n=1 Tax=Cajanus cajan TaxID=3821 RepID=A0A151TW48_CAJCA|nr:Cation/calcium exchanger 3 [Cajanus cajan]